MQILTYQLDAAVVVSMCAAVLVMTIGAGVLLYERFEGSSRRLALLTTITGAGLAFFALVRAAPDRETSLFWFRTALTAHAVLGPALYGLAVDLVKARRRRAVRLAWAGGLLLGLWTLLAPTVTTGVLQILDGQYLTDGGWAGLLYVAFLGALIAAAIAELVWSYRVADHAEDRRRAVTLAAAFGIGSLGMIDFFAATPIFDATGVAPFGVLGCTLVLAYAATRYRAFARLPSFATERILEVMGDGVLLVDASGTVRSANNAALDLLGRPEDGVTGVSVSALIRTSGASAEPSGAAEPRPGVETTPYVPGPTQPVRDVEMDLVRPDGDTVEVSLSSEPLRRGVEVVGSLVVFRDIRERIRAARALQSTEERYRSLFWNNPGLAYEVDTEGRIINVNRTVERVLGVKATDLIGRSFAGLIHPDDQERAGAAFERVMQGHSQEHQLRITPPHGTTMEIRGLSVPITRGGEVVGVFGVALDLTEEERVRRELELQRLEFVELFEGSPEAIVVTDEHDRVLRVNPEFTRTFGYEAREAVGRDVDALLVPAELADEGKALTAAARTGEIVRTETIRRRKDATLVDVSLLARELRLPGRPPQTYGIYRDITDRKQAERRLRDRESELRHSQRLEAVGKLAGGVAHDFNNLLTVINGHVGFALEELPGDDPIRNDLEEVERAGGRAARLTQQLLAFSRRQVLRPETVDALGVIADVRQMLGRLIGEHIRFETAHDGDARVRVDRGQLEQVLVNLVVNARDAMPEGGQLTITTDRVDLGAGDPSIEGWAVPTGEYVRIAVRDTGVGMDAETRVRAFDPFFTTKERGKGTGLGLATVFGIVKQSGGHITAESEPGRGTTIRVWLPAAVDFTAEPWEGEEPDERTAPAALPAVNGARSATILLVEDEKALRDLAARVLRRAGHDVITAADGVQGFDAADRHEIDLLVSDLVMPRMGGRELARRLRTLRPGLPVLFMSGYDDEISAADPDEDFLSKPFTPAELARRVDVALGAARRD